MRLNKDTGQITVFLSIILLAVIILAGVLVDASRISTAEVLIKSAVSSAARSVLAGYSSRLKENYGLFAFNTFNEDGLKEIVKYYLEKNLQIKGKEAFDGANIDLYGFRIENIYVSPIQNLSENKVFKDQILEYMKYRAPKEIIEGFFDRLSVIKDMGRMSTAYSKKVGLDKILGRLDKAQQSLKRYVDGTGNDISNGSGYAADNAAEKYINGFNLNGIWQKEFKNYLSSYSAMRASKEELVRLDEELQRLRQERKSRSTEPSNAGSKEDARKIDIPDEMENRIDELESKKYTLINKISGLRNRINETWDNLRYSLTGGYAASNEKGVMSVDKIMEVGRKSTELISSLESFLNGNSAKDSDFAKTLREELQNIKALILKGQQAADMIKSLENNAQVLNRIIVKLDLLKSQSGKGEAAGSNSGSLADSVIDLISEYDNHIEYTYEKPEKGDKADDPRKDKVKELKETLMGKIFDDRNFTGAGIIEEELPSRKKEFSSNFDEEDAPYIDMELSGDSGSDIGKSAGYEGELGNIAGDADLYDEEGMFQENALGFIGSIGSLLEEDLVKLRDNIYINEYIMGMFKNHVSAVKQDYNAGTATFLNGMEKEMKETFFESEVEYVLHGDSSEITNRALTCAQILLVRLGANTLHVYTDAKKRKLSVVTAAAVAGWWTGGAGIPIISNLIMCAWGMGEAIIDLKDLTAGKSVPIYKSPGDWKLDIGLPKSDGLKTDAKLYFSYHDYLRLFLIAIDEDEKLGRVEDLIEINIGLKKPGYKAAGCNTFIRVEAEISMKNLFISQPFIPESIRTADGRRGIRVLVYEGY